MCGVVVFVHLRLVDVRWRSDLLTGSSSVMVLESYEDKSGKGGLLFTGNPQFGLLAEVLAFTL
jgi:hypothetical protein